MAKEKIQTLDKEKHTKLFYYEILGIVLLIFTLLAIAKLGIVGKYYLLITKTLFGDWYFVILFIIIIYALRCILVHKKLSIDNIRYLGIVLIVVALIVLSHFNVHSYVKDLNENYIKITLKLYLNYFKQENIEAITGGGIIGGLLFYLFYYLFSSVGIIIISSVMIVLGIVFVCKKTIKEFILMIVNFFKNIYYKIDKSIDNVKTKFDKIDNSYTKKTKRIKVLKSQNILQNNLDEEKYANKNVETIKKVLNNMNIFYNDITYIITNQMTTYFIKSYYKFNYDAFRINLENYFRRFELKIDEVSNQLLVEMLNYMPRTTRLIEVKKSPDKEVIFGIDDRCENLTLNKDAETLIIFGKNKDKVLLIIESILMLSMYHKNEIEYYYINLINKTSLDTSNELRDLDDVILKLNNRIEKYKKNNVSTIDEYNQKCDIKDSNILVIISGLSKLYLSVNIIEEIDYLVSVGPSYGIYLIASILDDYFDNKNLINKFTYKLFTDDELKYNKMYLHDLSFFNIDKNVEGYLCYRSIIIRMNYIEASKEEIKLNNI